MEADDVSRFNSGSGDENPGNISILRKTLRGGILMNGV
jgi:hypothetical protein